MADLQSGRPWSARAEPTDHKLDSRAALGRAPGVHAAAVCERNRTHDREAEPGPAGSAIARRVGPVEAIEDPLALIARDPRSVVFDEKRRCPPRSGSTHMRTRPVPSAVCSIALPTRLRSACASRSGSARKRAVRHRAELEAAVGEQDHAIPQLADEPAQVDRLDPQELRLLALGEQQQVVDEAADACDLGLNEASTRRISSGDGAC